MAHHQYETAEYGEPLDLEDKIRVTAFRHGKRLKYKFERLDPPIVVTRPQISIDNGSVCSEDKGRSTT